MKTVSIKTVIARVLRTVRELDTDFYTDLIEWIAEALAQANTPSQLMVEDTVLLVKNHIAEKPCGFHSTIAIEYCGHRLALGGDITAFHKGNTTKISNRTEDNLVEPIVVNTTNFEVMGSAPLGTAPPYPIEYYRELLDVYHFSFEEGEIKLHYRTLPVDEEGYPLIPDNENLKQAIFYYCLMCLIGAGAELQNKELNWRMCFDLYENKYLPRAINEMKIWNPETAQRAYTSQTRLIFPQHFHRDFFKYSEQYQEIKDI
jgi:hypothetical protein